MVNSEDSNLELDDLTIPSQTQGGTKLGDLLSLPRLPTKRIHGKQPLVDFSSSHVVMSNQYLVVLRQKALEKKNIDKIREQKTKEKQEKRSRRVEHTFTPTKKTIIRNVEKENRARFNNAWFVATIKAVSERFCNNFRVRFRVHPLGYRGFGLGMTSQQQIIAKEQEKEKCNLLKMSQPRYNLSLNNNEM